MRNMTLIFCDGCGKEFEKETRYVKSAQNNGRKNYCNLSCHAKSTRTQKLGDWSNDETNKEFLRKMSGNRRDEYTPFRTLLKSCRTRTNKSGQPKGTFDLDLPYMKQLWEEQEGKCSVTKVELKLENSYNKNYQASLDRIDSSKGYTKGNVRYISVSVNWLKNNLDDNHLREFIQICNDSKLVF
jgi:hypothetical protein